MIKSKHLEKFKKLEDAKDSFELVGDFMLVERIPEEEKVTKGGLILSSTPSSHRDNLQSEQPVFCHVLSCGEGFYDDNTGEDINTKTQPGDVILVSPMSVVWFKTFGNVISEGSAMVGVTRESEIKMRFIGIKGYQKVFEVLGND